MIMQRVFPCLVWMRDYHRGYLASDLLAAVIVTVMLIPQSLAYALLAGLPPHTGLYASILPLVAYALFGTSRTLSVGPVAVASLMTAAAVGSVVNEQGADPLSAAMVLALLAGLFLLGLGMLRFGFLANFLSHPVISGFITASGLIIALGQMKDILGIAASGDNLLELGHSLALSLPGLNAVTLVVGGAALLLLYLAKHGLPGLLQRSGISKDKASLLAKTAPVLIIIGTGSIAYAWNLQEAGLALVGEVPTGLPSLGLPEAPLALWQALWVPALLIAIIGYVESVSVGKTLAAKRRQRIDPDQELIGLGAASMAAGFSGGFPVTGGFSRSVVNFDAGAQTQAASLFTALGIAIAALFLTDLLAWLPKAVLSATIIVAVLGLVDFSILPRTWRYARADFIAVLTTMAVTLGAGVEMGVLCGVLASIALHLYKTSQPHVAEVGLIPGTQHFRNVLRHQVQTHPGILTLRVDESLYFPNTAFLEDKIYQLLAEKPQVRHVILMCTAVNHIDYSALEVLEAINLRLKEQGIGLHLSEVKGPVMDALQRSHFLAALNGRVYLSQYQAFTGLSQTLDKVSTAPNHT